MLLLFYLFVGFVLELEMCFFCPIFFRYLQTYEFREFFCIYLDEKVKIFYKTINLIKIFIFVFFFLWIID